MWDNMQKEEPDKVYYYKDIKHWEGNWELIDGIPYLLASPSYDHQHVVGELHLELASYFKNRGCRVILSPFDVQLDINEPEDEAKTVLQPDLLVVCDTNKITKNRLKGAPDIVIEVLSASTGIRDRDQKYYLYEKNGVKEYWIVDPSNRTVEVLGWKDGYFQKRAVFGPEDTLVSILYPDLQINLANILNI
jgi:Uma2 family endonuclease